ncbi:MAG: hypothetical protein ABH950_06375, partial [Candidatus Altiarchaeota archaeon]
MPEQDDEKLWKVVSSYVKGDVSKQNQIKSLTKEQYLSLVTTSKRLGRTFHILPQELLTILGNYVNGKVTLDELRNWAGFIFFKVFVPFKQILSEGDYDSGFYLAYYDDNGQSVECGVKMHKPIDEIDINYVYETNSEVDGIVIETIQQIESNGFVPSHSFTPADAQEIIRKLSEIRGKGTIQNFSELNDSE